MLCFMDIKISFQTELESDVQCTLFGVEVPVRRAFREHPDVTVLCSVQVEKTKETVELLREEGKSFHTSSLPGSFPFYLRLARPSVSCASRQHGPESSLC